MSLTYRRSKKSGQRGMAIEYALVAFLTASALFQVLFAFGLKVI
jgi:hypothetical protein